MVSSKNLEIVACPPVNTLIKSPIITDNVRIAPVINTTLAIIIKIGAKNAQTLAINGVNTFAKFFNPVPINAVAACHAFVTAIAILVFLI